MFNQRSPKKQQGIALLSAMLIVALATAITVSLTFDQTLLVRQSAHHYERIQSYQYIFGLEDWVQTFLEKDANDSKTDALSENWAIQIPPLPIERGYLTGYIDDEQAKFNLNSLLTSTEMLTRFRLLCKQLDIEEEFILALLDWLDKDTEVRYPDGAEDDYYSGLKPSYRTANRLMADVSELLLIKGIKEDDYRTLLPFITVLPEETALNVNTMSKEVFLSLDKSLSKNNYDKYFEEREDKAFDSVQSMVKKLKINIEEKGLDVATQYFLVHGEISLGDSVLNFQSLINRKDKVTQVIQRRLGL